MTGLRTSLSGGGGSGGLLSTRRGTIIAAVGAALVATVLLVVFLQQYRRTLTDPTPANVLVAGSLIEKGSPGNIIASTGTSQLAEVRRSQLEDGAITDPAVLRGQVATKDIYPGEQLTAGDFTKARSPMQSNLTGVDRAIAVPLDTAHGMVGQLHAGDHVDVLGGFNLQGGSDGRVVPSLKRLARDVLVLHAPAKPETGIGSLQGQSVVLRVSDQQSSAIAFASDTGKVWLVLRPQVGARDSRDSDVTLSKLLSGVKPISVNVEIGGQRP